MSEKALFKLRTRHHKPTRCDPCHYAQVQLWFEDKQTWSPIDCITRTGCGWTSTRFAGLFATVEDYKKTMLAHLTKEYV
jgi:hypothetical protein